MIQSFDYFFLSLYHNLALLTKGSLNGFFKFISYLADGNKGFPLVIIAVVLIIIKKTRKVGLAMLVSILIGALFTNIFIKNTVARLRPFQSSELYYKWWVYAGSNMVSEFSFPSGHTTATMAAMTSIIFFVKSKWKYLSLIVVILMGISRNYLMVHYPSDVVGGIIVGLIAAIITKQLINYLIDKKYLNIK